MYPSIRLKGVQLQVPGGLLLGGRRISTTLNSGRLHLVVGPNGSGKTTLVRLLAMRGQFQGSGQVERVGHSTPEDIAFLPQETLDLDDVSSAELLALASGTHSTRGPSTEARCLGELSGGEQRLFLVNLVLGQAKQIHVYDEPLRSLDLRARGEVWQKLLNLVAPDRLVVAVVQQEELPEACPDSVAYLDLDKLARKGGEL